MNKKVNYTLSLDAEIGDLVSKVEKVKASMQSLASSGKAPGIEKNFVAIEKTIDKMKEKASAPVESAAVFANLKKDAASIGVQLDNLFKTIANFSNLSDAQKLEFLPPDLISKIKAAESAITAFGESFAKASEKSGKLIQAEKNLNDAQKNLEKTEKDIIKYNQILADDTDRISQKKADVAVTKEQIETLKKYIATTKIYENAKAAGKKAPKNTSYTDEAGTSYNLPKDRAAAQKVATSLNIDLNNGGAEKAIADLEEALKEQEKSVKNSENAYKRHNSKLEELNSVATVSKKSVSDLTKETDALNKEFEQARTEDVNKAFVQLRNEAESLGISLQGISLEYTEQDLAELTQRLQEASINGIEAFNNSLNTAQSELEETANSLDKTTERVQASTAEWEQADNRFRDNSAIMSRISAFVGLQGGIQLARRAMQNALSTIKELDEAMTEMAVVTDLNVGDYWEQLPEHTKRANALGLAIKDVYEAETLYYQQGLKTNEVIAMSNETLKMARIAGLSAEDATNKMTAALRGFNMELNETSAQRVADVYSELAAITASDVNEISSAMTKTASIASSAGMEFETTAAFLSQIIETTRESAETAGTAMKTVIARFQELKKDPSEIGEVEGEIVDANKIETALRSVGVSLRDTSGQFRELDDVFLELSSKWDSLDTNTQRYIATIAAGSRQQSRFIAMMSDYSRTSELVEAANTSAGASNEQFEKTLDSLDSKLAKLKNAWDTFTMGLFDNQLIKMGIDILTGLIDAINKLTDAFAPLGLDGAAKIGLLIAALYLGDKALKVFMGSLKNSSTIFQAFGATGRAAIDSINARFVSLKKLFTAKLNIKVGSEDLYNATAASKEYSRATKELQTIEAQRAATAKAGNLNDKESARYSQQAAEATAAQSAAEKELMATMGLSATQMTAVNALEALGVSTGSALILTKAGITAENLTQIGSMLGLDAAYVGNQMAEKLSNASGIRLISTKLALTVANWAQTASNNAETGTLWAKVTATIAQTMANWGLQASMWPILVIGLLILAAAAALIAIVWLLVKAFKAIKANSPEAKMAALKEKIDAASESLENAKEELNSLLENKAEYDALSNQIDSLTEGTTAWREAVQKLNQQVMDLIGQYSQLAQYVTIGENGVMSISDEGWEQAIQAQQEKVGMAAAIKANLQRQYHEAEKESNEFDKKTKTESKTVYKKGDQTIDQTEYDKLVRSRQSTGWTRSTEITSSTELDGYGDIANQDALIKLSELTWGTEEYNKAMLELKQSIGETDEAQQQALKSFDDQARKIAESEAQIKLYNRAILMGTGSAAAQASSNYAAIIESLEGEFDDIYDAAEDEAETKWEKGTNRQGKLWTKRNNKTNDALETEMLKYGLQSNGNQKEDLNALVQARGGTGYTEEQLSNTKNKKASTELASQLEELDTLEAVGNNYVDKIYELTQNNESIGELYGSSLDIDLNEIKSDIGKIEDLNENVIDALENRVEQVEQARKDIDLELEEIYKSTSVNLDEALGTSYDHKKEILRVYQDMARGAGSELAKAFAFTMPALSIEGQEDFLANYGDVDWSSSIEGAAALQELQNSDDAALRTFANTALELEASFYSATSQANEMYRALGDETIADLASDGKIAAGEILELAKSNEKLAQMMENTGVSAATLGRYYELIENGTLSASAATSDFLRVLEKLGGAADTIENSFAFLDNLEISRSGTEIGAGFTDMRNKMLELYNSGAFGDDALMDYIEAFIGEEGWQKVLEENGNDLQAAMEQVMNQVKDFEGNFQTEWQKLASLGSVEGVSTGEDGSVIFDFDKIVDFDTLKQQIVDSGWSEEMADAMLADAQTFGVNVKQGLKKVNVEDAFVDWLSTSVKNIGDKKIIDEGQFKAFIEESGMDPEIAKKALEENGIEVAGVLKADGGLADHIKEAIEEKVTTDGKLDLGETYQLMLDLGLEDSEAKKQLNALAEEMQDVEFTLDGQTVKEAGAELGETTYNGHHIGSVSGLIDGLEDRKVLATQKKNALEQASMTGQAMAAAGVLAARVGPETMAESFDKIINGLITFLGKIFNKDFEAEWVDLSSRVAGGTDALMRQAQDRVAQLYSGDIAEQMAIINSTNGMESDKAAQIYEQIVNSGGTKSTPSTGSSYVKAEEIVTAANTVYTPSWETQEYDRVYRLNLQINGLIKERERLERNYDRALKNSSSTAADLAANLTKQLQQYQAELQKQQEVANTAFSNIFHTITGEGSKYNNLFSYDENSNQIIITNESGVNKLSEEEREKFDSLIDYLTTQADSREEALNSIEDINDSVDELSTRGRDSTSNLYSQVRDGLIAERQKEIDALNAINDSVQSAQDALVNEIQKQIEETRQIRENEKTEQEISDKEARLAYLMRDTSGANALEIADLQKEIDDSRQDYADSLIDQQLQELQDANEFAAEQRQKQIELAEAQLEVYENSDEMWTQVKEIVEEGLRSVALGVDFANTAAGALILSGVDWAGMNDIEREDFLKTMNEEGKESAIYNGFVMLKDALGNDITFGQATHDIINAVYTVANAAGVTGLPTPPSYTTYKTGGLADFTGPAWLDGTKSHPELVLNARDTENFITLKNILADLLAGNTMANDAKGGSNYFDINITVESIKDDYDVEQLANKIKGIIYEDSMYRNVNTINLTR